MQCSFQTWFTKDISNYRATFKVYASGSFVIQSIYRGKIDVTDSLIANRYCSGMIRFWVANKMIEY